MDGDGGTCGMAVSVRAFAWPDGWFGQQISEQRLARTGSSGPGVDAIVHGRRIRVRRVPGWRECGDVPGRPGSGEGFARRAIARPPCEARERAEAVERVRVALDTLPGHYRQALFLVYVDGCTHGETAIRLAIPLGTAHAWVRRGLRALRLVHASLTSAPALTATGASVRRIRQRRPTRLAVGGALVVSQTTR